MDHLMHQPSDEVRGHLAGAGNAFGIDRTNNSKAPHASKRAFAGRAQPAGQSSQAPPPFFQASSGSDAQWPSTAVPNHHSNSPVATPQSGAGSPVGSNQMEAFKSMVFQMATFFQQNPEATLPPGFEGLFGQMSVGGASPIQPQQQQQHHMSSQQQQQALFGGGANGGYDYQQAFTPPTTTTTAMMMDDAIVDSGNVVVGSGRGGAQLPKPQRRVFAEHPDNGSAPQARLGSANQQHRGQQQDPFPSNPNNSMTYTGTYQQSNRRNNNQQPSSNNNISARSTPNHHNSNMRGGDQQGSQRGGPSRHNNFTASHHQQSNAMDQPTEPKIVVLVEFKRQRMKKYESQMFVSPGQYVVVEGDRGVDCGFVIHCCVREIDGSYSKQESIDNVQVDVARIKAESGRVIRLARDDDVKLLHGEIASSELIALKTCRDLAERMGLSMEIVDCEYQFDRKKISFYFEAPHSVDFRELNTELFRIFGARIWLENLNSKVKNVVPDGALSHADKLQYTKNGLRPPRRT